MFDSELLHCIGPTFQMWPICWPQTVSSFKVEVQLSASWYRNLSASFTTIFFTSSVPDYFSHWNAVIDVTQVSKLVEANHSPVHVDIKSFVKSSITTVCEIFTYPDSIAHHISGHSPRYGDLFRSSCQRVGGISGWVLTTLPFSSLTPL